MGEWSTASIKTPSAPATVASVLLARIIFARVATIGKGMQQKAAGPKERRPKPQCRRR